MNASTGTDPQTPFIIRQGKAGTPVAKTRHNAGCNPAPWFHQTAPEHAAFGRTHAGDRILATQRLSS